MALKVGIYDAPQVKQQGIQGGLADPGMVPNIGASLAHGVSAVGDAMVQETERLNRKRVEDFDNKLTAFDIEQRAKVSKLQGQMAFAPGADGESPMQPFVLEREKFLEEATKDFTPKQRELARGIYEKSGVREQAIWMQHQDQQLQNWTKSVALNGVKAQADAAIANINDPKAFNESLAKMGYHMQEANPGIEISETIREEQSKVALKGLRDLMSGGVVVQPESYQHLFEHMTADDKSTANDLLAKGNAANLALKAGDQVWYSGMTKEAMLSVAGSMSNGNATVRDAIMREFELRDSAHKEDMKRYDVDTTSGILYNVYAGKQRTSAARRQIDLDPSLSPDARKQAMAKLKDFEKSNKEDVENLFPDYAKLVTSPEFPTFSRDEIMNIIPRYGKLGPSVLSRWEQSQADGGASRIPQASKDFAIAELKLDKKDPEQMAVFNAAVMQVMDTITRQSKGKGRYATKPPTAADIAHEIVTMAKPRVVKKHWYRSNETAPLATMSESQQVNAVAALDPEQRQMARVVLLREGNSKPTTAEILKAYDDIDAMKVNDKIGYEGLKAAVQPPTKPTAQTRPMDRR